MPTPSELAAAYQILDVPVGASEAQLREARVLLLKVWHPDRHAHDPDVLRQAQRKVQAINAAFELIRAAGFPAAPVALEQRAAARSMPTPPPPIEFVPRRRVRWPVVLALVAVAGIGGYVVFAALRGSSSRTAERSSEPDPWATAPRWDPIPRAKPPRVTAPEPARTIAATPQPAADSTDTPICKMTDAQARAASERASAQQQHDLLQSFSDEAQEREREVAKLDAVVVEVDQHIANHEYEQAQLASTRIHWTVFHSHDDKTIAADYDTMRETRLAIIKPHLPGN